ncbi:MAG TPA: thioredoxin family protein [Gammaproteobacteria bacterium]
MRILTILAVLTLLLSVQAVTADTHDPYKHFFNETFGDFAEEVKTARAEGKQGVLIFFEMDECPFCHFMKTNVLNRPDVQEYYRQNFLSYAVDIEGDIEITDFAGRQMTQKDFSFKENRVRATPVIAFYDLEGKEIFRHTGRTSGAEEFLLMGRFVAEGAYKQMPFTKFKRSHKK